jgi:RNA polymerase sigma factor (sigma-70 family)
VGERNGQVADPVDTRALLAQIAAGELAAKLRAQVAAWHPSATREQVEDAFQQACLLAEEGCRGQAEGEVFTWLRTTTHRELGRMLRRARFEMPAGDAFGALEAIPDAADGPVEQLIEREDHEELTRVAHAVVDRLSERQRHIAALHARDRRRPEIAQHLGLTPRTVKRQLERIMAVGRAELVRLGGHGCDDGEPIVTRFAFGLASPREVRLAQLHLATCPKCSALYDRLEVWREKVAAVLPIPAVEHAEPGFVERTFHQTADGLASLRQHVTDGASATREHAAELTGQLKQHAAGIYYRAVDPTPLAGMRPGAAGAAIASCVALGGGATYCLEQGVDPFNGLKAIVAPEPHTRRADAPTQTRAREEVAAPTETAPQPDPQQQPTQTEPQPVVEEQRQAPPPPPPPEQEFEPLTSSGGNDSSQSTSPRRSSPAPAPSDGAGEFDGP